MEVQGKFTKRVKSAPTGIQWEYGVAFVKGMYKTCSREVRRIYMDVLPTLSCKLYRKNSFHENTILGHNTLLGSALFNSGTFLETIPYAFMNVFNV